MFGDKIGALKKKRAKALGVFVKAKNDLIDTNKAIGQEVKLANLEISKRKEEIRKEEQLIKDFQSEQKINDGTITKISSILE